MELQGFQILIYLGFYSKLVRLKESDRIIDVGGYDSEFLFQIGTIKSLRKHIRECEPKQCFYSKLVRLKA